MRFIIFILLFTSTFLYSKSSPIRAYSKLVSSYGSMRKDSYQNKLRHNYFRYVRYLLRFNKNHSGYNPRREHAKYHISVIHHDLAFVSGNKSDFIIAYNNINTFISRTHNHSLRAQAHNLKKSILNYARKNKITQITNNVNKNKEFGKSLNNSFAMISKIVHHKNSITLHTSKPVKYFINTQTSSRGKKITIEIHNSKLTKKPYRRAKSSSRVKSLRYFQFTSKIVKLSYIADKKLFPVVTVTKKGLKTNFAVRPWKLAQKAKEALVKKFKVLIDPGHGGIDPGTIQNGIKEKNVNLSIAKKLGAYLKKENFLVKYTRTSDKTLTLNQRAEIAQKIEPDVFISIHLNSSKNKKAFGIETYYFDVKSDETTKAIAARENSNGGPLSDLDFILRDLSISNNFHESGKLASIIHNTIIDGIKKKHRRSLKNRGTRGGPFYVLYKTGIPSILIEAGFLSNRLEARKLKSRKYQNAIAKEISKGLLKYKKSK